MNLGLPIEKKIEEVIYFFHEIYPKYDIKEYVQAIVHFINKMLTRENANLCAMFFSEIFFLGAPEYSHTEENEARYILAPALTLSKLNSKGFDIAKIIGSYIQMDHEGKLGYQISQIIEIILEIKMYLGDDILKISDLYIGLSMSQLSNHYKTLLFKHFLALDKYETKVPGDHDYPGDHVVFLSRILMYYLYNNTSIWDITEYMLSVNNSRILAEAFKLMIDRQMISLKRLIAILREFIDYQRLEINDVPKFISLNFSQYEIASFIAFFLYNGNKILDSEDFYDFLVGFSHFHGFNTLELRQIIEYLLKIKPNLLIDLKIEDLDKFFDGIKL